MNFNDLRWADAGMTILSASVDDAVLTFPADEQNRHYAAVLAGELDVAAFLPPTPQVPEAVRRYQGLIALLGIGITEQAIRDRIALIEDPVQREMTRLRFEQPEWRRDSNFITWGGAEFELSAAQVDQLFIDAWSV